MKVALPDPPKRKDLIGKVTFADERFPPDSSQKIFTFEDHLELMIHNIASHNWFSFQLQDSIFEISTVETFATEVMANRPQTLKK